MSEALSPLSNHNPSIIKFAPILSLYAVGSDAMSDEIKKIWQNLITDIHRIQPVDTATRLISGFHIGAEQAAIEAASQVNADVQLLIENKLYDTPGLVEAEKRYKISRIVSLGRTQDQCDLSPNPLIKRHEMALNFTDLVLCYWDAGGKHIKNQIQLGLMRAAALSRKPMIWLNPQGQIYWLDLTLLDDATLLMLESTDFSEASLLTCFRPVSSLQNSPLKVYLKQLFNPELYNPNTEHANLNIERLKQLVKDEVNANPYKDFGRLHEMFSRVLHGGGKSLLSDLKNRFQIGAKKLWQDDHEDIKPKPTLTEAFERHDDLANQAGGLHRSNIWLLYGFAALAVLAAVAAEIWQQHWLAYVELGLIASIIYRVWWARKVNLHERWISHRYLAEQIRYCIMGYPTLAIPKTFRTPIWQIEQNKLVLSSAEIWLLQRHLISTGLPCEDGRVYTPSYHNHALAEHIRAGVQNQKHYHQVHHHEKHLGHQRLHSLAQVSFVATFVAVIVHLYVHEIWLLLFTAALPAFAAATHGILTKLEMERISGQSALLYQKMDQLDIAFNRYIEQTTEGDDDWQQWVSLHNMANCAQQTMSDNITQWQHLIQKQQTDIPA